MSVEFEKETGRQRYRFGLKEIERYAGKDVPHTVIKSWIHVGRNLQKALDKIEIVVNKASNNSPVYSIKKDLTEIEKKLIYLEENQKKFLGVFFAMARLIILAASADACKFSSYDSKIQNIIRLQDETFKHLAGEFSPGLDLDYFLKNITGEGR